MSRISRDKGARIEREIVALHIEIGVKAERVPLSGSVRYRGNGADIDVYRCALPDHLEAPAEIRR